MQEGTGWERPYEPYPDPNAAILQAANPWASVLKSGDSIEVFSYLNLRSIAFEGATSFLCVFVKITIQPSFYNGYTKELVYQILRTMCKYFLSYKFDM